MISLLGFQQMLLFLLECDLMNPITEILLENTLQFDFNFLIQKSLFQTLDFLYYKYKSNEISSGYYVEHPHHKQFRNVSFPNCSYWEWNSGLTHLAPIATAGSLRYSRLFIKI